MATLSELLTKYKPSKKTLAIVAAVAALVLGASSGTDITEIMASADKIAPVINAIIGVVSGGNATVTP